MKLYLYSLIKLFLGFFNFGKPTGFQTDKPKAVILLVPIHGNLGDQALSLAGRTFVDDHFPEYEVVEVTMPDLFRQLFPLRRHLKKGDLVFLQGGGSMGSRYPIEEMGRWLSFAFLSAHPRILFPQSSSFDLKSPSGRRITRVSQWVYRHYRHKLLLCIRDRHSLAFMEKHFPDNRFMLFPDIVLYLDGFKSDKPRSGVRYCLRDDVESRYSPADRQRIRAALDREFAGSESFDTTLENTSFTIPQGRKAVAELLERISRSELVVTDRLHGVILSYISNTPVLALPTVDHKLVEFFRWIEGTGRSVLLEENPEGPFARHLEKMDLSRSNPGFRAHFEPLVVEIRKALSA